MSKGVLRLLVVAGPVLLARASAASSVAPITVEVGFADRHRDFLDTLFSDDDTDRSDQEVARALGGRRWLELVDRDGEVALAVTRRSVAESSRSRSKDGKLSITWRYVVRAGISAAGDRDRLEATTTSSVSLSENEAARARHEDYRDRDVFGRLAEEIADKANDWILAHIEALRPERPDAGFRHETKHRWLVLGDGLEVTAVAPGSPAARAGLEVGDRIRVIDGEDGTAQMDLRARTWWIEPAGTTITLEVEREKRRRPMAFPILLPRDWERGRASERVERAPEAERASRLGAERVPSARIERGMPPDDVERALGKPQRVVSFESKTVWIYDGLRVVFVDGRVTDIE